MIIPEHISEKLNRLYSKSYLGQEEIVNLEKWLDWAQTDPEMENWLKNNWEHSAHLDVDISFEEIHNRIKQRNSQFLHRRVYSIFRQLQKVAAILMIPLLVLSVWMLIDRSNPMTMALVTAKGEHSHVFLPDGSEVWLNVDSKLEYSTGYNTTNRSLKLKGEALFKVVKDKKHPFIVDASGFRVKAIGTVFLVSNYDNESQASTFLKEGIVELSFSTKNLHEKKIKMKQGERATINSGKDSVRISSANSENALKWSNGELYFENEPLDQVFRKVERWYNVSIQYDLKDFSNETLNVHLKKGESIDRLFQIMDQAIGIKIMQNENVYVVTRK